MKEKREWSIGGEERRKQGREGKDGKEKEDTSDTQKGGGKETEERLKI